MIKWLKALGERWRGIREHEHSERQVMPTDQPDRATDSELMASVDRVDYYRHLPGQNPEYVPIDHRAVETSDNAGLRIMLSDEETVRLTKGWADSEHHMPAGTWEWDEFSGFYHIIPPDTTDALAERRAKAEELLKKLEE